MQMVPGDWILFICVEVLIFGDTNNAPLALFHDLLIELCDDYCMFRY